MIKLSEIIEALEDVDINMSAYYNTKTNEILWQNGSEPEYSTYKKEDEFNDEVIFMFDFTSKNDYDIMLQFIYTIDNSIYSLWICNAKIFSTNTFHLFPPLLQLLLQK